MPVRYNRTGTRARKLRILVLRLNARLAKSQQRASRRREIRATSMAGNGLASTRTMAISINVYGRARCRCCFRCVIVRICVEFARHVLGIARVRASVLRQELAIHLIRHATFARAAATNLSTSAKTARPTRD